MQGVDRIQKHAGRAGAGERGANFVADISRFADSDDDDLPSSSKRLDNEIHRFFKGIIELRADSSDRFTLDGENFSSDGDMIHGLGRWVEMPETAIRKAQKWHASGRHHHGARLSQPQ